MIYLKPEQYYIDLYDLHTIEECLDWFSSLKKGMEKKRGELKDMSDEAFDKDVHKAASYTVNVIKIQRFRHKAAKLQEWMDRDRRMQEMFDNAVPPVDVYCKECFSRAKVTSKDLMNSYEENAQVLFMFECVKCQKRQALYEDGTEWKHDPPKCPKCNCSLNYNTKHTKDKMTTFYSCPSCSYKEKDVHDFKKSGEWLKKKEERDKKLLGEYRKDFCLDEDEGKKAVHNLDSIVRFVEEMKEKEKKEKNPIYQKANSLKKLKIGQLKELLEKAMEQEGYKELNFGKPEMGQYVIIDFTVNDIKDEREEYKSVSILKKLIKGLLEETTWRLMSEGVHYRLGILSGRLKAYEREEELMELVKKTS